MEELNKRLLDRFKDLTDRDIVCVILHRVFKVPIRDVAAMRNMTRGQVFYSVSKLDKLNRQDELMAIIQEIFLLEHSDKGTVHGKI